MCVYALELPPDLVVKLHANLRVAFLNKFVGDTDVCGLRSMKSEYSREPKKIMIVLTAKKDVAKEMERIAEDRGVKLMIGRAVD
jgi:uncharacterized membrane protein